MPVLRGRTDLTWSVFFLMKYFCSLNYRCFQQWQCLRVDGQSGSAVMRLFGHARKALCLSAARGSKPSRVSLKFLIGPAALTVTARAFINVAYCQEDINNNVPVEVQATEKTPEFHWTVLWEFVRPQILALLGAVIVSDSVQLGPASVC